MLSIANTSHRFPVRSDAYFWIRRNLEWLIAAATFAAIGWQRDYISTQFAEHAWSANSYYSAAFAWASIQGAFLFSVYAFFLSRSEPFIKAIAQTEPFRALRRYVLRALWLSLILTVVTLPLLVGTPVINYWHRLTLGFAVFWFVSVWLAYTFMCFVKVIRVFRKLESMQDEE